MISARDRLKPAIDILNRFSGWLLLLAIIWLSWTVARLLWLLLAAPTVPALPLATLQNNTSMDAGDNSLFAIFADPTPVAAATLPPPNIILKGVLLAVPNSASSALLDVNGEVKNYRIGDELQESGYTLIAVDWDSVIISDRSDQQTIINMPDRLALDQSEMIADGMSNQRLPTSDALALPQAVAPIDTGLDPSASTNNADESPQSAISEAVTALQENPASYLSRMGVMASGEGYQVTAAMPSSLRNRLGLEPGDKVLSVNGQNVGNNPGQDSSLLQQVQQSGEAQIEVQRGDQVITIRQQF
ncbi:MULTISPECIES: type II secretion system protein N [unclassified Psychrobacter]|uniref:type II secretion system protein N n=1 Tax=unclassified Psychrobacter TaxID=196806 RepID=UPI003FD48B62